MVYLAEDRIDNSKWALKVISKSRVFKKERLRSEIEILKKVNHKHIIKLREDFEDDSHIYLVQEQWINFNVFFSKKNFEYFF